MLRIRLLWLVLALLVAGGFSGARAGWSVDLEGGAAFNGYNDVRIPGNSGTDLSLSEELEADPAAFWRVRLTADLGTRHRLSLLVAPLRIEASGRIDREIDFNGARFSAAVPLESRYRFDSYRLTYRYTVLQRDRLRVGLGVTAKIRDAAISLRGGDVFSEKTNTGFVPLINFALDWSFFSDWGLIFEGDALAAPQGRAEDVLLGLYAKPAGKLRVRLGYRVLEGGADNDEVYNFALVHYLSAGLTWSL
jgi:hypothetical protein